MTQPLWQPSRERSENTQLGRFMRQLEAEQGLVLHDYDALYDWSIQHPEAFWNAVWSFAGIVAETRGERTVQDRDALPGARWFPDARLNFAENLLRRRDDTPAILFQGEDRLRRELSHAELYDEVSRVAAALRAQGIVAGDRVAGFLPNLPEAVVAMLAAASLGAVWTSCSPDFGVRGVLDRFGQIEPRVLFAADGYFYKGRAHDSLERLGELLANLPSVEQVVVVPYTRDDPPLNPIPHAQSWNDFVSRHSAGEVEFAALPFNHPLYILYSSGTTGAPKCIVHGAGGTLIQHLKEHLLHADVKPGDRLFYFTTLGWMMWNWLVSGLASEATLVLYDGNPFHPDGNVLFDLVDREQITIFGTSAKYLDAIKKADLEPSRSHDLGSLRSILSTGSPLSPEGFDYVYRAIKQDVCLSSIAGGTDIVSCFVAGNPSGPVWRGEIQKRALGMAVDVFDEKGNSLQGEPGELVCKNSFPSMPLGFWNDPEDQRYRAAYFERYPNAWHHGDWCELTAHGGIVMYGRSDAVLNPGGVRIGTAEIYRQVEQLDDVVESIAVGQSWDDDVRVVLFVKLREGTDLGEPLVNEIKQRIRQHASPRHVPAKILQVNDIPRTKSGKIVELAVRDVIHGRPVRNVEALENPAALEEFRERTELRD